MRSDNETDRSVFTDAYIECALWSSHDGEGTPLDEGCGASNLDSDTEGRMREDCADFIDSNSAILLGVDAGQSGHDFWLTRNGHGAGFWDRGLGEQGDKLSEAAKSHGTYDLYVGDDGKIYGNWGW